MAKTKRKRRKKHRGTQGGSVARAPRSRPRNRAEAKARARSRKREPRAKRDPRGLRPPSWTGALGKGALASLLFFALFAGIFHRPIGASAGFAAFMLAFYVPLSYYLDG
ncbi:MAG: hypothetical protein ACXWD7_07645, partial [Solirubrobacterales bacterium]